ncbi:hypothetical protein LENED_012739 [Lentinula edodes]|uniref:Uncharacterized protein n=1 Tax=Lentinula edodes TaxID=5353 RepID=A0A1Q3ETD2_LENED|nr:hypothetical protein LENED_012739 [Lentinula edodes]
MRYGYGTPFHPLNQRPLLSSLEQHSIDGNFPPCSRFKFTASIFTDSYIFRTPVAIFAWSTARKAKHFLR